MGAGSNKRKTQRKQERENGGKMVHMPRGMLPSNATLCSAKILAKC